MRATANPPARRGAAVVIAAVPVRIGINRLAARFVEGDVLGRGARRAGQEEHRSDALRIIDRPLQRLHPAHAAARHRKQRVNAQVIEQMALRLHHIGTVTTGKRSA